MILSLPESRLRDLVLHQLASMWPAEEADAAAVEAAMPVVLGRLERCFSRVRNKYYSDAGGQTRLDHLHGCQWAHLLYALSREVWLRGGASSQPTCDRLYALNRMQSGADLFYQVALPEVMTFDHPLGSVMGRGTYSDYLTFSQGCTVGNNHGRYPTLGSSVFLLSDSKVIGGCRIGDNVIVAANAYVRDVDVPSGSIVFGQSPNLTIKTDKLDYVREHAESVFVYD